MYIQPLNIQNNNKPKILTSKNITPSKISFTGFSNIPAQDIFFHDDKNIKDVMLDNYHRVTLSFAKPVSPVQAIWSIAHSNNKSIQDAMFFNMHNQDSMVEMATDISGMKKLTDLKISKMIGMGSFAFVFELQNGKVLKITNNSHFYADRKQDFFDLPIEESGKFGRTYYYIEEKVRQDNIADAEIDELVKKMQQSGYKVLDIYTKERNIDKNGHFYTNILYRHDQFGRAKDGKIYLIDPGCAIAPSKLSKYIQKVKLLLHKFRI